MVTLDGAPWFVTADVLRVLQSYIRADGRPNTGTAVRILDDAERANLPYEEAKRIGLKALSSRAYGMSVISESGLYKLVMRSDKPQAKDFQNWVTQTVLPSIRKDGGYVLGEEKVATGELSEDEFIFKAMSMLQAKAARLTEERDEALKAQALAEKQRDNNRAAADALAATVGPFERAKTSRRTP